MDYGLRDKVALITGVNNPQGIGAATALAFAREGVRLALVYKRVMRDYNENYTSKNGLDRYIKANGGDASEVEKQLRALGADYMVLENDISDESYVKEIFDKVIERYNTVEILVNNAASCDIFGMDTTETLTQSVIDDTMAVNIKGTLLMIREFVRRRKSPGRIINISTDSARVFAGQIIYGASKATIEALTRSISYEVGKYGITVNCVAPGPTQTGYIDAESEKRVLPEIPLGKLIAPQNIADAILFLAGDKATMITGQTIQVSGGHAV